MTTRTTPSPPCRWRGRIRRRRCRASCRDRTSARSAPPVASCATCRRTFSAIALSSSEPDLTFSATITAGLIAITSSGRCPGSLALSLHHLDRGIDGAAARVAKHHDQRHAQKLNAVLDRRQEIGGHEIAGNAHDEKLAGPLIESELGRHARIRTRQDRRHRILRLVRAARPDEKSRSLGVFAA